MDFSFIHPDSKFSEEQKKFYETNGYIIFRNNISDHSIEKYRQRFIDICEERTINYQCNVIRDPILAKKGATGEKLISKVQDFCYDDIFGEYCFEKPILEVVENIIGPNITAVHSMLINKPPDSDPDISKHPLHQDLHYFPFRPAHQIVASWTAMEDVNERNGCLYIVPGSHHSPLYPHRYSTGHKNGFYHGIEGMDHLPKINAVMKKGDTIFFHPLILHGSGPNFTKGFRKAISSHFADSNCYFIDVSDTSQANIKEEIEALALKKTGSRLNYVEIWKAKSRYIQGELGAFQRYDSHL